MILGYKAINRQFPEFFQKFYHPELVKQNIKLSDILIKLENSENIFIINTYIFNPESSINNDSA